VETCRFLVEHTACRVVVDPFCGHGTILAVANAFGLDAIGVEISSKRVRKAQRLLLDALGQHDDAALGPRRSR
jgi:tRNA G10  N-methylase Trm11